MIAHLTSRRNLGLAIVHASVATVVHLSLDAGAARPGSDGVAHAPIVWATNAAALLLLLMVASAITHAGSRIGARRWGLPGLVAGGLPGIWLLAQAAPSHDAVIYVGGGLGWLALAGMTLTRRVRGRGPPDRALVADAVAGAWSALVFVELIWHISTGSFYDSADLVAFLHGMSEEAEAMLLGPATISLAGLIAGWLGVVLACSVTLRRGTARSHPRAALAVLIAGALALTPAAPRKAALHHVHPSTDDLARLLLPPLSPTATHVDMTVPVPQTRAAWATRDCPMCTAKARHALVVLVDSISRDALPPFGPARRDQSVAPNIARLAAQGRRFTQAYSNASHTDLATTALAYGLLPHARATKADEYRYGHTGLPLHLLAQAKGFRAGVFSADWERADSGYAPLFPSHSDAFLDVRTAGRPPESQVWAGLPEHQVADALIDWLPTAIADDGRFFAHLKLLRPHFPYYTPPSGHGDWTAPFSPATRGFSLLDLHPNASRGALLRASHDNAIHYMDHQLGRVLDALDTLGVRDETAILFVTDHGEGWGEHGLYLHGNQHFEEFVQIPMVLSSPGVAIGDDDRTVSLIDAAPTLLGLLGLAPYPVHQGQDLLSSEWSPAPVHIFSNNNAPLATRLDSGWKYTIDLRTREEWLYNLADDPTEQRERASDPTAQDQKRALSGALLGVMQQQRDAVADAPSPAQLLGE